MNDETIKKHLTQVHAEIESYIGGRCLGFFAGGAFASMVRFEKPKDYDVWFRSKEDFDAAYALASQKPLEKDSRFAITFTLPSGEQIQFVRNRLGTPEHTADTFDFDHTRSYFDPNSGEYAVARECIEGKILRYQRGRLEHPVNSFQRVMKFAREGYHMDFDSIKDMMLDLREVEESVIEFNHAGSR